MVCMCLYACMYAYIHVRVHPLLLHQRWLHNHFTLQAMFFVLKLPYSSSHVAHNASLWSLPAGKLRDDLRILTHPCPHLFAAMHSNSVLQYQQHQMRPWLWWRSLDCVLVPLLLQWHQTEFPSKFTHGWMTLGLVFVIISCLTDNYIAWWKVYLLTTRDDTHRRIDPDNSDTIHDFISIETSCLIKSYNYWKFHLH